jgi:hypothetical protein
VAFSARDPDPVQTGCSATVCFSFTYLCHVSDTHTPTAYLIRGCYTFRCHIINYVSGLYVPSFHVTHILIRSDPVHATYPNSIAICDGMSHVAVISLGGSNSMQLNYSIYLWQQLQRHHRPSYYMPYFISNYSATALKYNPLVAPFISRQISPPSPSRGVRLN